MDWNISNRSEACQVTQRAFADGENFYTVLYQNGGELERLDLSQEAWPQPQPEGRTTICFWKSAFKATPSENPAVDTNDAESELKRLAQSNESADIKACFLLAALLERKRLLKFLKKTEIDGQLAIIYENTQTQEPIIVREPEIHLNDLSLLEAELKLSGCNIFKVAGEVPTQAVPVEA